MEIGNIDGKRLTVAKTLTVREWFAEDIEANSLVEDPANEQMFSYFSNDHKCGADCLNCTNNHKVVFSVSNEEKRIISGLVMKSGSWIPRADADGEGNPGYIYFSRESVRKMKELFGMNRKLTIHHTDEITGDAILLNSYIKEAEEQTEWWCDYKIVTDKLWGYIKQKKVVGFSMEAYFTSKLLDKKEEFAKYKIKESSDFKKEDLDQNFTWVMKGDDACPSCQGFNGQVKTLKEWIHTALPRTQNGTEVAGMSMKGLYGPYNTFCEHTCRCYMERVLSL